MANTDYTKKLYALIERKGTPNEFYDLYKENFGSAPTDTLVEEFKRQIRLGDEDLEWEESYSYSYEDEDEF